MEELPDEGPTQTKAPTQKPRGRASSKCEWLQTAHVTWSHRVRARRLRPRLRNLASDVAQPGPFLPPRALFFLPDQSRSLTGFCSPSPPPASGIHDGRAHSVCALHPTQCHSCVHSFYGPEHQGLPLYERETGVNNPHASLGWGWGAKSGDRREARWRKLLQQLRQIQGPYVLKYACERIIFYLVIMTS